MNTIPNLNSDVLLKLLAHLKQMEAQIESSKVELDAQLALGGWLCLLHLLPGLGYAVLPGEKLLQYSDRVVGDVGHQIWNYLFAGKHVNNAPMAVKRIKNVLNGKFGNDGQFYEKRYNMYLEMLPHMNLQEEINNV